MAKEQSFHERIRSQIDPSLLKRHAKFQAKLTFFNRCSIFALDRIAGVNRRVIAAAFGVNRATVAYICNPSSGRYRDVKKEHFDLGDELFYEKYVTPDVLSLIEEYKNPETAMTAEEAIDHKLTEGVFPPRKSANKNAGPHRFRVHGVGHAIEINIVWLEGDPDWKDGWYVDAGEYKKDIDILNRRFWFPLPWADDQLLPFRTSTIALSTFVEDMGAEEL